MKFGLMIGSSRRRRFDALEPEDDVAFRPQGRTDHLIKMNLIPLMGRRNAAFDRITELLRAELFSLSRQGRRSIYFYAKQLLRRIAGDTEKIISVLSSPDTKRREESFLKFVRLLDAGADALESFVGFEAELSRNSEDIHDFSPLRDDSEYASSEEEMTASEIMMVNQMRAFFDRVSPKVARYREYVSKSLSKSNAERYRRSHEFYLASFRAENNFTESSTP